MAEFHLGAGSAESSLEHQEGAMPPPLTLSTYWEFACSSQLLPILEPGRNSCQSCQPVCHSDTLRGVFLVYYYYSNANASWGPKLQLLTSACNSAHILATNKGTISARVPSTMLGALPGSSKVG